MQGGVVDVPKMFRSLLRLVEDYVPVQEHRPPKWQLSPPQALMRRRAAA